MNCAIRKCRNRPVQKIVFHTAPAEALFLCEDHLNSIVVEPYAARFDVAGPKETESA